MIISLQNLKESELMTDRLGLLVTTIEPYIGKYFSADYVSKKNSSGKLIQKLLRSIMQD
jgi:hypothetical protein